MSARTSGSSIVIERRASGASNKLGRVRRQWLRSAFLSLIVAIFLILYSGVGRPIWLDEFLQFAFGGFPNTTDAWAAIIRSMPGTNVNQTGVYMLIDFWLLKIFGASALALRLPSIVSAGFLCYAAMRFFEFRSISFLWKIVLLLAFASHATFVYYVGEARPYMPLTAAVVGMLAFYSAPPEIRRAASNRLLGFASVLLGTLFHPYFPLYWISVLTFLYGLEVVEGKVAWGLRAAIEFADLRLIIIGILVFGTISEISWLPRGWNRSLDPFEWIHRGHFWVGFLAAHFAFLSNRELYSAAKGSMDSMLMIPAICLFVLAAICAGYLLVKQRRRKQLLTLLPPIALVGVGLGMSLLISYIAVLSHFWILDRQWIASMALVTIGVVWLFAEIGRHIATKSKYGETVVAILLVMYFTNTIYYLALPHVSQIRNQMVHLGGALRTRSSPDDRMEAPPADPAAWVALANENIDAGGAVWPVFRKYYED